MKMGNPTNAQRAAPKRTKRQSVCQVFGKQKNGQELKTRVSLVFFILAVGGSFAGSNFTLHLFVRCRLWNLLSCCGQLPGQKVITATRRIVE
jgi:hypothetical protein